MAKTLIPDLQDRVFWQIAAAAKNGRHAPSARVLAEKIGCSADTIKTAVKHLVQDGKLSSLNAQGAPWRFEIPALGICTTERKVDFVARAQTRSDIEGFRLLLEALDKAGGRFEDHPNAISNRTPRYMPTPRAPAHTSGGVSCYG